MPRVRWKILATLSTAAALASLVSTAVAGADASVPQCVIGALLNQGTTTISFSGGTATAVVSGWSFCGESTQVAYGWSTGATSQSISVAPGQCVSVTAFIGSASNGLAWTQSASGCAPSDGGSGGGGGGGGSGGGGGGGGTSTCDAPNVTGQDSDADGIDDACDPTPFPYGITTGSVVVTSDSDVSGPVRVLAGGSTRSCNGNARLKTRELRASWVESFLSSVTFLAFTARYQVCYVPNKSIQWAVVSPPNSPYALVPWTWLTTNDSGFPSAVVTDAAATFQWQGSAAICAFHYACANTRHPGLTLTFRPNNTETRTEYVG